MFTVKDTNLCNQMNLMGQSIFLIEVTRLEERIATVKVSLLVLLHQLCCIIFKSLPSTALLEYTVTLDSF